MAPSGNKLRGEVEIVLDGEKRTLRLSQGDLAALNERFDRGTFELLDALQNLDMRVVLATLHRALYHGAARSKEQPSEQDLGELDWVALNVADALGRCIWRSAMGEDPEELLSDSLRRKVEQEADREDPPPTTGEQDGEQISNSPPASVSSPSNSGNSPPTSSESSSELTSSDVAPI